MGKTQTQKDKTVGPFFTIQQADGLDVVIGGGSYSFGSINETRLVAKTALTLDDDSDNYVYIDLLDDTVKFNSTGFPKASVELYKITTVAGSITATVDYRSLMRGAQHSEFFTLSDYVKSDDYNVNQGWTVLDLSAVVPVGATTVMLRVGVRDSGVVPDNEVYFAMKHPDDAEDAWSRMMKSAPIQYGVFMWYLWPVGLNAARQLTWMCKVSGMMTIKLAVHAVAYG